MAWKTILAGSFEHHLHAPFDPLVEPLFPTCGWCLSSWHLFRCCQLHRHRTWHLTRTDASVRLWPRRARCRWGAPKSKSDGEKEGHWPLLTSMTRFP